MAPPEIYTYRPTLSRPGPLPISPLVARPPDELGEAGGLAPEAAPEPDRQHHLARRGGGGLRPKGRRLPIAPSHAASFRCARRFRPAAVRSEEHTSELQSLMRLPYAVFCLQKKKKYTNVPK